MGSTFFIYLSKRSQRIAAALLSLLLAHVLAASYPPETVTSATYVHVRR
jgi:hypothetical protein